jgi:hypothetical protein
LAWETRLRDNKKQTERELFNREPKWLDTGNSFKGFKTYYNENFKNRKVK